MTIDAEEAERLGLSLELSSGSPQTITRRLERAGLAVQAYQKAGAGGDRVD